MKFYRGPNKSFRTSENIGENIHKFPEVSANEVLQAIIDAVHSNNKINLVIYLRWLAGLGLNEAKDAIVGVAGISTFGKHKPLSAEYDVAVVKVFLKYLPEFAQEVQPFPAYEIFFGKQKST